MRSTRKVFTLIGVGQAFQPDTASRQAGKPDLRKGFTLIELLVVVAISGVMIGLLLCAVQGARASAARAACASNLRQLALAIHGHEAVHGELPQGCAAPPGSDPADPNYLLGSNWLMTLLPFVEQEALAAGIRDACRLPEPDYRAARLAFVDRVVPVFLCPADGRKLGRAPNGEMFALTCYLGSAGTGLHEEDGLFHVDFRIKMADITDGTSNTLLIGERPPGPNGDASGWFIHEGTSLSPFTTLMATDDYRHNWPDKGCPGPGAPGGGPLRPGRLQNPCDRSHYWSLHPRGANFAFADGSVRFLPYSANGLLPALSTRAGGESVSLD
ncbi:MAG: DUF1559 domain-containing protein [Gemmataceae bacterium]|nr:DUF1559 domain-containing protein [Gemmataceae bacterium]